MTLKSSTGQIEQPEKNQLFDQIRNDNLEKILNPNIVANFLSFLLITNTVPSNQRFNSYEFSKCTVVLKSILDRSVAGAKPQISSTR
jgi:hypothetical protein